jgi:hypothetical protein
MSQVTNVLLTTAWGEGFSAVHLLRQAGFTFISCNDEGLPVGWYAGTKMLECEIYPGAFNHLDLNKLVAAINAAPWESPESVQLFVQGQDEDRFREVDLFGERRAA